MATVLQDVRFAIRLLAKDRSFTITALLTLTICLAANTAMFSLVRTMLLKPLPFPDSDRVVLVYNSYPKAGATRSANGVPDYFDRLRDVPALEDLSLLRRGGMTYGGSDGAERLISIRATPSFFRLVRAQPEDGRIFRDDEGEVGKDTEVILSHGFRQRKFGDEGSVVGRTIRLNGTTFTIVGVLPADFNFVWDDIDVFVPAAFTPQEKSDDVRHSNSWQMVGRLKPGATIEVVRQQLDALNRRNDERFPQMRQLLEDAGFTTVAVNLRDDLVRDLRGTLYLLWGGVLFVLLIGGVNIANLVTVRAQGRAREMATRHALGADVARLARQMLTETVLLALVGGLLGVGLGWSALRWVKSLNLQGMPRAGEIGLDPVTVAVALLLTLAVGLVLGLAPAWQLRRMNLNVELSEQGRGGTAGRRMRWALRGLATAQVAIAFVLLIGAGLLLASFRAVMDLDFGFNPDRVTTAMVSLPQTSYQTDADLVLFEQRALEAVRALPDVESAGLTTGLPFTGALSQGVILAEGYEMQPGESLIAPLATIVSAGYFETMRIPLVRGRYFNASDTAPSTRVAIIDERLAEKFWPGRDAVGRRLYMPSDAGPPTTITPQTQFFTVVGVVRDVQVIDPRADFTPVGAYYFPFEQATARALTLVVQSRGDQAVPVTTIREKIAAIDPELPLYRTQSMQAWIDTALIGRRLPMQLALAFGATGLFLATVGIYGVLAYGVSQRKRELGVRMALGGSTRRTFTFVLRDGAIIAGAGLAIGLGGAIGVGRLMASQLFGVAPADPTVLAFVALILLPVALGASAIPAWRATRINPIIVLSK